MTKRLFQNQTKMNAFRQDLDRCAARAESANELARRNLVSRMKHVTVVEHRRRSPLIFAAVATGIFLLGMAFWGYQTFHSPRTGENPRMESIPIVSGELKMSGLIAPVPLQRIIRVPSGSGAKVVIKDNSTLWMAPETQMTFQTERGDLKLENGELLASFNKRNAPTFIRAADCTIEVLGTIFSVNVTASSTVLRLFEGRVALDTGKRREIVNAGTHVTITNGTIEARRPIDASDVISALLIPEKTFHLPGPEIPELALPDSPEVTAQPEPDKVIPMKRVRSANRNRQSHKPMSEMDSAPRTVKAPPPDEMAVAHVRDTSPGSRKIDTSPPAAEQLLKDACTNLKSGNHETGKAKIRNYLQQHPNDRYWEHVHSIFE